jgi:hypothetical protein
MQGITYEADKPLAVAVRHNMPPSPADLPPSPNETIELSYSGEPAAESYCAAIFSAWPKITNIAYYNSPSVMSAMAEAGHAVPAVLDDYAQMIGVNAKIARSPKSAAGKLKGRNAVFIKGVGVLCCAGSESDCSAIMTLAEKNAMAYVLADRYGKVTPISYIDRRIMRHIYVTKYSKKK